MTTTDRDTATTIDRAGSLLVAADLIVAEVEEMLTALPEDVPDHEADDVRDRIARLQERCDVVMAQLAPASVVPRDIASGAL